MVLLGAGRLHGVREGGLLALRSPFLRSPRDLWKNEQVGTKDLVSCSSLRLLKS